MRRLPACEKWSRHHGGAFGSRFITREHHAVVPMKRGRADGSTGAVIASSAQANRRSTMKNQTAVTKCAVSSTTSIVAR